MAVLFLEVYGNAVGPGDDGGGVLPVRNDHLPFAAVQRGPGDSDGRLKEMIALLMD